MVINRSGKQDRDFLQGRVRAGVVQGLVREQDMRGIGPVLPPFGLRSASKPGYLKF